MVPQWLNAYPNSGRAWTFRAEGVSRWDYGDGSTSPDSADGGRLYAADGTYTVTATNTTTGAVGTAVIRVRGDQNTAPPSITTITPVDVPPFVVSPMVITGQGFGVGDVVEALGYDSAYQAVWFEPELTSVTATEIQWAFDAGGLDLRGQNIQVWVRKPDGTATRQKSFNVNYD